LPMFSILHEKIRILFEPEKSNVNKMDCHTLRP
jgi:hypothetical protein